MASLAPPISIHLTRRQLRWLDTLRLRSSLSLSRSAVLREAIDALIQQQEEGTGSTAEASRGGEAVPGPLQLELTSQAAVQSQAEPTTSTEA